MNFPTNFAHDLSKISKTSSDLPHSTKNKTKDISNLVNQSMKDSNIDLEDDNFFKVYTRIRKTNSDDKQNIAFKIDEKTYQCLAIIERIQIERKRELKNFFFDGIFSENENTQTLFKSTMKKTIHRLFQGYNSTILAYGMTGSGKTYTMFGDMNNMSVVDMNPGLIILSVKDIFWKIHRELNQDKQVRFRIKISFLEIYNETIKDLLSEKESFLNILEDSNKDAIIPNLTEVLINEPQDILALIEQGNERRVMAETSANKFSSRSHVIFTIYLEKLVENTNEIISGKLALVDLAGSERACVSMNIGLRMKEGANINRSLLALGNCIIKLSEDKSNYVPYRDSKLTRILKDSLAGNTITIMLACISPLEHHYEETINTLKYANRVKQIKGNIKKNIRKEENQVLIFQLKKEIEGLNEKLKKTNWEKGFQVIHLVESELAKNTENTVCQIKHLSDKIVVNLQNINRTSNKIQEIKDLLENKQEILGVKRKNLNIHFENTYSDSQKILEQELIDIEQEVNENEFMLHKFEKCLTEHLEEKNRIFSEFENFHEESNKLLIKNLINSLAIENFNRPKLANIDSLKDLTQKFAQKNKLKGSSSTTFKKYALNQRLKLEQSGCNLNAQVPKTPTTKSSEKFNLSEKKSQNYKKPISIEVSSIDDDESLKFDDINEHENEIIELKNFDKKESKFFTNSDVSVIRTPQKKIENLNLLGELIPKPCKINPNILNIIKKQKMHLKEEYEKLRAGSVERKPENRIQKQKINSPAIYSRDFTVRKPLLN